MLMGPEEVAALLPQRAPLALVDGIIAWQATPRPSLSATYTVPADHPVLAGHFPERPLWPGVYLIEGLAQAALLLGVLMASQGGEGPTPTARGGLLASVDVKLVAPVFPGDIIIYDVVETHVVDALRRFAVDARVAGRPVARGALTVAVGAALPERRP